jgi:hypothetical protein
MAGPATQAHLDALARQIGFHDYATYNAYQQKQAAMRMDNGIQGTGYNTGQPQQPQQNNWLQNLIAKIPIHPAYLLGKVNDAFTQAGQ